MPCVSTVAQEPTTTALRRTTLGADCYERSLGKQGGTGSHSSPYNSTTEMSGLLSTDCIVNPEFCNFHLVYVLYCDGFFFTGSRSTAVSYGNSLLYFRGADIRQAVIDHLANTTSFPQALEVLMAGGGAGASALYVQMDSMADEIRAVASGVNKLRTLPVSGFFLRSANVVGQQALEMALMSAFIPNEPKLSVMNAACMTANPGNPFACMWPDISFAYTLTPTFVVNSKIDYADLTQHFLGSFVDGVCVPFAQQPYSQCLGVDGEGIFANCTNSVNVEKMLALQENFLSRYQSVAGFQRAGSGAYITSCASHKETMQSRYWPNKMYVNGKGMEETISAWWYDLDPNTPASTHTVLDCGRQLVWPYRCNPTCGPGPSFTLSPPTTTAVPTPVPPPTTTTAEPTTTTAVPVTTTEIPTTTTNVPTTRPTDVPPAPLPPPTPAPLLEGPICATEETTPLSTAGITSAKGVSVSSAAGQCIRLSCTDDKTLTMFVMIRRGRGSVSDAQFYDSSATTSSSPLASMTALYGAGGVEGAKLFRSKRTLLLKINATQENSTVDLTLNCLPYFGDDDVVTGTPVPTINEAVIVGPGAGRSNVPYGTMYAFYCPSGYRVIVTSVEGTVRDDGINALYLGDYMLPVTPGLRFTGTVSLTDVISADCLGMQFVASSSLIVPRYSVTLQCALIPARTPLTTMPIIATTSVPTTSQPTSEPSTATPASTTTDQPTASPSTSSSTSAISSGQENNSSVGSSGTPSSSSGDVSSQTSNTGSTTSAAGSGSSSSEASSSEGTTTTTKAPPTPLPPVWWTSIPTWTRAPIYRGGPSTPTGSGSTIGSGRGSHLSSASSASTSGGNADGHQPTAWRYTMSLALGLNPVELQKKQGVFELALRAVLQLQPADDLRNLVLYEGKDSSTIVFWEVNSTIDDPSSFAVQMARAAAPETKESTPLSPFDPIPGTFFVNGVRHGTPAPDGPLGSEESNGGQSFTGRAAAPPRSSGDSGGALSSAVMIPLILAAIAVVVAIIVVFVLVQRRKAKQRKDINRKKAQQQQRGGASPRAFDRTTSYKSKTSTQIACATKRTATTFEDGDAVELEEQIDSCESVLEGSGGSHGVIDFNPSSSPSILPKSKNTAVLRWVNATVEPANPAAEAETVAPAVTSEQEEAALASANSRGGALKRRGSGIRGGRGKKGSGGGGGGRGGGREGSPQKKPTASEGPNDGAAVPTGEKEQRQKAGGGGGDAPVALGSTKNKTTAPPASAKCSGGDSIEPQQQNTNPSSSSSSSSSPPRATPRRKAQNEHTADPSHAENSAILPDDTVMVEIAAGVDVTMDLQHPNDVQANPTIVDPADVEIVAPEDPPGPDD